MICVFPAVLLLAGCNLLESPYIVSSGDGSSKYPHSGGRSPEDIPSGREEAPDTVLWVSAVEFPEDYDWRRDSAFGNVEASILLYRNFEKVLSVPVYGNPEQDRHHIVSGELFSESVSGDLTTFCRNGTPYLQVSGNCTLTGILESDGHLYALVRPMGCEGFTLYKDGAIICYNDRGHVCGDMSEPAFSPGGAVYMDDGCCTFCYWTADADEVREWHCVREGSDVLIGDGLSGSKAVRMSGGCAVSVPVSPAGYVWEDVTLWDVGAPAAAGVAVGPGGRSCAVYRFGNQMFKTISPGEGTVYVSASSAVSLSVSEYGVVSVCRSGGVREVQDGFWGFVCPSQACLVGDRLLLALNPKQPGGSSAVLWGQDRTELSVRGFLSNVSYTVEKSR